MDWVEDNDDDDGSSGDDGEVQNQARPKSNKRPVRLLDYACGTGTISRVTTAPDCMRLAIVQAVMPPLLGQSK